MKGEAKEKGFVAITSLLVIAAVVLVIGISVSLLSVSEAQISLDSIKSQESLYDTESCVEEALFVLDREDTVPSTITLPGITCNITIESQSGSSWIFVVEGTSQQSKTIRIEAEKESGVKVLNWREI